MLMRILVFNAGRYLSTEGGAVLFKNLVVNHYPGDEVYWVDPVYARSTYDSEEVEESVPKNVTLVKGFKSSPNPLMELYQREKFFLEKVKGFDADVAVFYNSWGTYFARRYLKKKGVPLVFHYIDLMHEFRSGLQKTVSRWSSAQALRQADLVVATAAAVAEDAEKYNDNVKLIPNGVDLKYYARAKPKKLAKNTIGFVGALGEWIDVEGVLDAATSHPRANFLFVGDGPKRKLIDDAALPNVRVTGFVPREQARDYAAGFDVALVPFKLNALTHGVCPIKMFEYWALGKPVIAAPTREIKRIAGDAVEYAAKPRQLSKAIKRVLSSKARANYLSRAGKQLVRKFDWRALGKAFHNELEALKC